MTNKIRFSILGIELAAVILVLGKLIFYPTKENKPIAPFVFPAAVSLPQWQLLKTGPVNNELVRPPASIYGKYISGKHYRYIQNDLSLDIEMRYLAQTNGNIKNFIKTYTGQLLPVLHEEKGVGFYTMFVYQDTAYLSACINPRGYSTVTADQFRNNGLVNAIRLEQIASWLTSQTEMVDRRCLWAHFSLPLNNYSEEDIYPILETAWFDWYEWWSQHFPKSSLS